MLLNGSKVTCSLRGLCLVFAICSLKRLTAAQNTISKGCDYTYEVTAKGLYIGSKYPYPPYSSCRYILVAPLNHNIIANCSIDFPQQYSRCSTESCYYDRDGSKSLRDSEQLCGKGTFSRKSTFRSAAIAYNLSRSTGLFRCHIRIERQACDCGWSASTKIVNGQEAFVNDYPSMVALKDRRSNLPLFCAAVIISRRYILTAAHCAKNAPPRIDIEARVGRHNLYSNRDTKYAAVYYIGNIIVHPKYTAAPSKNDIALMQTTRNIEYSRGVGPICLPSLSDINIDFSYSPADVIGWGHTKFAGKFPQTMRKVNLMVLDNETCKEKYANRQAIYSDHICTTDSTGNNKDSCQYDSGGPVIYKNKRQFLIGIVSLGSSCGVGRYPIGINTRITSYLKWIYKYIDNSLCNVQL